ncbi:malto-oligosyltrehalose synthase [Streptantibioticus parmotrematis]|uniref:malto-oligosyltrehalose synthase n=1 Tax=Streptantibioticus parmotrematis TaxID=2873249 RepID=UPI0033E99E70
MSLPPLPEPAVPPVPPPAVPTATYRLQIQPEFPFAAAERAVLYLAGLGVSHLHLSPVLEAGPGSTHGYDVTGHDRVREELGGEEGLRSLAAAARAHGLGLVVDLVPNHMAVPAPERLNGALWEVLRDGPGSPYARWFDVDWAAGDGRLLLPVLGGRLPDELDALRVEGGELRYYDHAFPLRPGTEALPLPELLAAQHYRLAWWRLARTELNYRRFFTISQLIAVRVEDPEVFEATHATVLRLLRDGVVDGLRIDHPDGLADPAGYLARLRKASGGRWTVVEKVLCGGERLPRGWACAGTTGYDALRRVDGVFVDADGVRELADVYREFTGCAPDEGGEWAATARRAAYEVVEGDLTAEVERLGRSADRACAARPELADHAPWALRTAIRETLVRFPVYRPYEGEAESARQLERAAQGAREAFAVPEEAHAVDVVRELASSYGDAQPDVRDFAVRFAQVASALHAKAEEDRAFYRYVPLLSANEVGGEPGDPAVAPDAFHDFCVRQSAQWPDGGTALSTHDTKRSADVRARLAVLSQVPAEWQALVSRLPSGGAPDRHVAWVAWQTALGLGAPDPDRLVPAVLKSVREAGLRTSWTEGDQGYEDAVAAFVRETVCGAGWSALAEFAARLAPHTEANRLGAALLHLTMPGVPDVYQGTESVYEALVDPDNRPPARLPAREDRKTVLTRHALRLRGELPEAFAAPGTYEPLTPRGASASHLLAFSRGGRVVTAVTRLSHALDATGGWHDTTLPLPPGDEWTDVLTGRVYGEVAEAARLFADGPVALLRRG